MTNRIMRGLIAALALAGLVVSSLALRVHFMDPAAAPPCAVSEHWDCGAVNHSKYAVFPPIMSDEAPGKLHIPVAALGIVGYTTMLVLALLGRLWAVLQFAEIGFAFACFLSYIEAWIMETWCIYCVWSQAIVTAIVLTTIVALILRRRNRFVLEMPSTSEA